MHLDFEQQASAMAQSGKALRWCCSFVQTKAGRVSRVITCNSPHEAEALWSRQSIRRASL